MSKWLVVKLGDRIPDEELLRLLSNVNFHEASSWYENAPDVFENSEALDKARNTWFRDGQPGQLPRLGG
jgi:hypothetical protein